MYVWGDPETGCLGRKPSERRKFDQALLIEATLYKNVKDIYTGSNHSFCRVENKKGVFYYGWGLNNWGQLGVGSRATDGEVVLG